jgi:redox-sensitive bicupin YhaK (pirin superfamily)
MTAGAGVLHSEMPAPGGVHSLQLWLNLPAAKKRTKARYADRRAADAPVVSAPGVSARLYTGKLGDVEAEPLSVWPMTLIDLKLDAGAGFDLPVTATERAFVYVLEGAGKIGGAQVAAEHVAWARGQGALHVEAASPLRALFYSAEIIDEPVIQYGPFVMNTQHEIREAIADYHAGRLAS